MAYFDSAATTYPKPDRVYSFMDEFYRKCGGNVGRGDYGIAMVKHLSLILLQSLMVCLEQHLIKI